MSTAWKQIHAGDLMSAQKTAQSGLDRFPDLKSEWHWRFLSLKAEILMRQGRYEESLALLDVQLPSNAAQSETAVWQKLTQGTSLGYLERYPEAANALEQAEKLASSLQPQLQGEVLLRKGTLASLQWDLAKAQSLFRSSLQFARANADPFLEASALGSLGVSAARMEHHDESIDWNEQALQLNHQQGLLGLASKAEGNLGWSYFELGDFANALTQYNTAEQEAVVAGLDHERVLWLTNSAVVHYELHEYAAAQEEAQKALDLSLKLGDPADTIECFQNSALIALQNSSHQEADHDLQEASRLAKLTPDPRRDLYTALLSAHLATRLQDFAKAEPIYSSIADNPAAPAYLHWESLAGLAQVYAAKGRVRDAEKKFEQAIDAIAKARVELEHEDLRFAFLSSAIRFYDQYVNFLIGQSRPLDALRIADLSRAQSLESGLTSWIMAKNGPSPAEPAKTAVARVFRPQEIAARFHATLLFYWLGRESSHLWVITPTKTDLYPLPRSSEIDEALTSYRETILKDPRDPLETGNSSGKKLYEMLIRPAEKSIPGNSRIIILPDGALNSLNFETLPVPDPKPHYWIEDVTISIANSLSLLSRAKNASPPQSANLLLFADPVPPGKEFPRLADAEKETAAIRQYFPEARRKLFLGQDARASRYLSSNPGKYSYLHFGTHGIASLTRPLESAVILTREGDSYKLYARDIVQHPLNAYLVTISACDGAGKRNFAGEGLIGLSWAFLRAGAHNVVAGLWEVSTASTPQLMDKLYKGLNEGKDPATALRNAKLSLIHSAEPYHRPFYWAPFQLYSGS